MRVLDAAIYAKLTGDTGGGGVNTLSNGGIYQLNAKQAAPFNFTVFQELLDTPDYAFSALSADHVFYQIKHVCVDDANNTTISGPVAAGTLADRTRVLLTDPTLNVTGKTMLYCRFNRSIPTYSEWDATGSKFIYHKGGIYEIWLA